MFCVIDLWSQCIHFHELMHHIPRLMYHTSKHTNKLSPIHHLKYHVSNIQFVDEPTHTELAYPDIYVDTVSSYLQYHTLALHIHPFIVFACLCHQLRSIETNTHSDLLRGINYLNRTRISCVNQATSLLVALDATDGRRAEQ